MIRLVIIFASFTIAACVETPLDHAVPSSEVMEQSDREQLRALDQAYMQEWKENDADGVMALFTDDATLMPHHGDDPIVGREAIRNHWFNPEYAPTTFVEWTRTPKEVWVNGNVGVLRGRAQMTWIYEGWQTAVPVSNYMMVATRAEEGWRIRFLTWNDDPRDWVREPAP
ncbi:MAG: nuclear transport factor 2 family protein [Pseudomonadota bacterium]